MRRHADPGAARSGARDAPGLVGLVLTFSLVSSLLLLPLPCADDLFVELGITADQCTPGHFAAPTSPQPGDAGSAACPCACHFGIAAGPAPAQLPEPVEIRMSVSSTASVLDAPPSSITHPPLA